MLCWQHWPVHRAVHTLLTGAIAGIIWGLAAYPLRNIFAKLMQVIHLPYKTSLLKMIVSGILGIWLHIIIDAPYNWDINLFWPSRITALVGPDKQKQYANCLHRILDSGDCCVYCYSSKLPQRENRP